MSGVRAAIRARIDRLDLRMLVLLSIGGPVIIVLVAVGVGLRGLHTIGVSARAESASAMRGQRATQRVLTATTRAQLASLRLLQTRAPSDRARFDSLADDADRIRRDAMREPGLSNGERGALRQMGMLQRQLETGTIKYLIAQRLGRVASASEGIPSVMAGADRLEGALARYRQESDSQRVLQQAAAAGRIEHARNQVAIISGIAIVATVVAIAVMIELLVRTFRAKSELLAAKDVAEQTSRLKSDFLATMSHEIRTPMNGVMGMIGLALDTKVTNEQRDYLTTAKSSAEALLVILNDILDFSKIEAGKLEIEAIPFDLRTLLEDVSELLGSRAYDKGLEMVLRVPPDVPRRVIGDPGRLRQILINLLGNAIKFTESGYVVVEVTAAEQASGGDMALHFGVRDTGIGIPADRQQALFEKFTQVDASTTRRFGGTGLGLAISRRLVEIMGGRLGLTSTFGVGTTFHFSLRLPVDPNGPPPPLPRGELGGVRVLIVDDVTVNRTILLEQLTAWGMRPDEADSAETAKVMLHEALAKGDAYHLALLDFQMPDEDGEQLARWIRADARFEELQLVLLTSSPRSGDGVRLDRVGFAAYFGKPVRPAVLVEALVALCGARESGVPLKGLLTRHSLNEAAERPVADLLKATRTEAPRPRRRVLVAEDNPVNKMLAKALLGRAGWDAVVVDDGRGAVAKHAEGGFDLILMDVQMPEMDGLEATMAIRAAEGAGPRIPIIAMTATAMEGDRERCLAAGMDDYVSKPIVVDQLFQAIERWCPQGTKAPVKAP